MSDFDWPALTDSEQLVALHRSATGLSDSGVLSDTAKLLKEMLADAWDEGHRTPHKLGPDGCKCWARSQDECACGEYGANIITPNPYRGD